MYARTTGIKVNMSLKGSGEALAQLIAEKDNPKTDVWFGGTGDPHLQAAEQGLTLEYKSPTLAAAASVGAAAGRSSPATRPSASTPGRWASATTPSCWRRRSCPCRKTWADLLKPEYKGEIQVANPASSGTAYTMIATLVQLMGEDKAFDYLEGAAQERQPVHALGHRPDQGGGARRDRGVDQLRARRARARRCRASRSRPSRRAEGTGAEIGSMSIIKGARNLEAAKKFYEWALTPRRAAVRRRGQAVPAAEQQGHAGRPRVPDFKKIKFINYDYAKYGASAERRRLIARWEKEVNSLPR